MVTWLEVVPLLMLLANEKSCYYGLSSEYVQDMSIDN